MSSIYKEPIMVEILDEISSDINCDSMKVGKHKASVHIKEEECINVIINKIVSFIIIYMPDMEYKVNNRIISIKCNKNNYSLRFYS